MEEVTEETPIFALEEQLARQKGILANSNLLRRLPDKGAKVRDSFAKLEAELERRKRQLATCVQAGNGVPDAAKLEWMLKATSLNSPLLSSGPQDKVNRKSDVVDSDDDEDPMETGGDQSSTVPETEERTLLKMIATSQITQRQAKPVIPEPNPVIDVKPDPYLFRLVEQDVKKVSHHQEPKFLPGKSIKKKISGGSSPASSQGTESGGSATSGGGSSSKGKWDEALLPPKWNSEGVKLLSMEDTIKISCDKYKHAETMKAAAPPKKTYAYDKLKEEGILGSYTVAMQTSRPVRADVDDDDLNDGDLSHDSITEDSESEESDTDNKVKQKGAPNSREKTSKDLSNILNTSLRLS